MPPATVMSSNPEKSGASPSKSLSPELTAFFSSIGSAEPDVLRKLCDLLPDASLQVRRLAADVLIQFGPDAAPAVPTLIKMLHHPDPARQKAVEVLGFLGPV